MIVGFTMMLIRTGVALLHAKKQSAPCTVLEEEVIRVDLGVDLHHLVEEIRVEEDLVGVEEGEFCFVVHSVVE